MKKHHDTTPRHEPESAIREALDLHELYMQEAFSGFERAVIFQPFDAQTMVQRLRGIEAIAAVLLAAGDGNQLHLAPCLVGGLATAAHALARDAVNALEELETVSP